jgi:outer membrane lipoprotein SlyB
MENFVQPISNLVPNWEPVLEVDIKLACEKVRAVRKNVINSFSAEIGALLGDKLGSILGMALGTELGTALCSEL